MNKIKEKIKQLSEDFKKLELHEKFQIFGMASLTIMGVALALSILILSVIISFVKVGAVFGFLVLALSIGLTALLVGFILEFLS